MSSSVFSTSPCGWIYSIVSLSRQTAARVKGCWRFVFPFNGTTTSRPTCGRHSQRRGIDVFLMKRSICPARSVESARVSLRWRAGAAPIALSHRSSGRVTATPQTGPKEFALSISFSKTPDDSSPKEQAVRSFQVAIHMCPSERALWQEDLTWAWRLQKQNLASKEKIRQEEETKKQILDAPELQRDYDFESDEVLAACEAVAERQTRYEELKRTAVVVDAEGNVKNVPTGDEGSEDVSKEQFVKARGL